MRVAGRLRKFLPFWESLTEDHEILEGIAGAKLEFEQIPFQSKPQGEIYCSVEEKHAVDVEVAKYLELGIIEAVEHEEEEFVSKIFPRLKKNGKLRIILDLSVLNLDIKYEHFKMESLGCATNLMSPGCYFSSLDLKDAYYSVSIHPTQRKYLRFSWNSQLYEFTCLPNVYTGAPRLFTKIMKPIFGKLRSEGLVSVFYLEYSLLIGASFDECKENTIKTAELLSKAGFILNAEKSVVVPTQEIQFLGFILNSNDMTIRLPEQKLRNNQFGVLCFIN